MIGLSRYLGHRVSRLLTIAAFLVVAWGFSIAWSNKSTADDDPASAGAASEPTATPKSTAQLPESQLAQSQATESQPARAYALSSVDSAAQLVIASGHQVRLIAAEPQAVSPVDAAFDGQGRLWVVEMIDYPFQPPTQTQPRGRVRILTDVDGDGQFETSSVFADALDMPTGIGLWRDGAVITLGGQLIWMRDTDSDGQADQRQVWMEGFAQQNEQLRANHPRLELDGQWYIASGLRGGKIQIGEALRGDASADPFELGTRDVRLNPRSGVAEAITGPAQFGLTSDLVGSRMFCSNRNPCVQVIFEQAQLTDNPLAGVVPAVSDVMPAGESSKVYPLIDAWTTSNLHAGQFTAACGVHFQPLKSSANRSDQSQKRFARETLGRVYVCEPTGSLVHMQPVAHGSTLWSVDSQAEKTADAHTEWLASRDPWFRPVNVVSAPGGGVLVIDMHRSVIEHPAWVPDELKNRTDERYGADAGRIYWAANSEAKWPSDSLREVREHPLADRSNTELVELLTRDDDWLRRTAARLLIERDAIDALPALLQLVIADSDSTVETRVCVWQLVGLLDPNARNHLKPVLKDTHRQVQVTALRLLSRLPIQAAQGRDRSEVETTRMALDLALTSEDPWVRLEAALCAASSIKALDAEDGRRSAEQLGRLAGKHADDGPLLVATAGAARLNAHSFMLNWIDALGQIDASSSTGRVGIDPVRDQWITSAARLLTAHVEKQDASATDDLLARLRFNLTSVDPLSEVSRLVCLTALTQHARINAAQATSAGNQAGAADAANEGSGKEAGATPAVSPHSIDLALWRKIRDLTRSSDSPKAVRLASIELLGLSPRRPDAELLENLSQQTEDGLLRNAAIKAWSERSSPAFEEFLISQVAQAGPSLRPTLIDLMLANAERHGRMLQSLEKKEIAAKQLGAVELKRFVDRAQGEAKVRFQAHLDSILNSDRAAVLDQYKTALDLAGDNARGKQVFTKHCAACHRVGETGVQVGPDISDSRVQTPDKLLMSILDPNRAIDNNYFRFIVLTTDGRTLDGLIAEETSDKVVLRSQNDQRHVLARGDIEQLKPTGVSMMPEGLETQIDLQAMADLIAFIKNWRYDSQLLPSGIKAGKQ